MRCSPSLWLPCLLTVMVLNGVAPALADEGERRVVVYKLKADEALSGLAGQVSDALLLHLGEADGITVLGEDEIQVMLAHEKDKTVLGCDSGQQCLANLQKMIDAEKVVTGHLGKLGKGFIVTLKLADTKTTTVEAGESAEADDASGLVLEAKRAVDRLLGLSASSGPKFEMEVAPEGTKAAVIDLAVHGVAESLGQNLTQLLSLELKKFKGLGVISRDEIKTMLRFQAEKQILTCSADTECLVEIGGALGVDYLVTGSVGQLGDAYVVTLKLMDVHGAQVVNRASESLRADEAELAFALRFATWKLLGQPLTGTGTLAVRANVDEGQLVMGSDEPRAYPKAASYAGLAVGKYGLTMTSDGYRPLYKETYVMDGRTTQLRMSLDEVPRAWYEQWWTWAIIGGVVAAGVTTTLLLLPDDSGPGTVNVEIR